MKEKIYRLSITVDKFNKHKNVDMQIFRWGGEPPFNPRDYLPPNVDGDVYCLDAIKESFTMDEIEQIKEFFKDNEDTTVNGPEEFIIPKDGNIMGWGAMSVGGNNDFYVFCWLKDYPLPFKIAGYYDTDLAEDILREQEK